MKLFSKLFGLASAIGSTSSIVALVFEVAVLIRKAFHENDEKPPEDPKIFADKVVYLLPEKWVKQRDTALLAEGVEHIYHGMHKFFEAKQ